MKTTKILKFVSDIKPGDRLPGGSEVVQVTPTDDGKVVFSVLCAPLPGSHKITVEVAK